MATLGWVLFGQCVFVFVVIFVLKIILDKELINAALEKFESAPSSEDLKEILVYSAVNLSDEIKSRLEIVRRRKFVGANFNFLQNAELKGGIVISMNDTLLDFSLTTRLQQFWS